MARANRQDAEAIGSDSFLDVVTNIVGILIILVMVVGIRIKHGPPDSEPAFDEAQAKAELANLEAEAVGLESDVRKTEFQIQTLAAAAEGQFAERGTLAYVIAEHERELDEARKALDGKTRHAFDLRRARAKADLDLARVEQAAGEAIALAEKFKKPIKIQSRPTPISHTVYGNEVHFRLMGGRIAWAPIDELAELCNAEARMKFRDSDSVHGSTGPISGFLGEYDVRRLEVSGQVIFQVQLIPVASDLGEPVEQALEASSDFHRKLGDYSPRGTTVTLWTYPDSFGDYSKVKEDLYRLGFSVAARPWETDQPIGGSNIGRRSAAQ